MSFKFSSLAVALGLAGGSLSEAATFTSEQNGNYWCTSPAGCAWTGGSTPGSADTAVVAHLVILSAQGATPPAPMVVPLGTLNLVSGGNLRVAEARRLEFGGGTFSGGTLDGSYCCGTNTWANLGALDVTGNPVQVIFGLFENGGMLRVAPAAEMLWNPSLGTLANLSSLPTPAVLQLDGSGRIGGNVSIINEGIVRKTGAGISVLTGKLYNLGTSAIYPGRIDIQAGTLRLADQPGFPSAAFMAGGHIDVAAGAELSIRDGGRLVFSTETTATQVYRTTGSGDGRVLLETGGELWGDVRIPGIGAAAILDFDPGVFEWTGSTFGQYVVRNEGEITISGSDAKILAGEVENAGHMRLLGTTLPICGYLFVLAGGTFEAQDGSTLAAVSGCNPLLVVDGTLRKASGSGTLTTIGPGLRGNGRVEIHGGHFLLQDHDSFFPGRNNASDFIGTIDLRQNAALDVRAGENVLINETARLIGTGSVNATQLEQRGYLEAGAPFGALAVSGRLYQIGSPQPVTRISIGGTQAVTQYAQIQVSGNLRPQGILNINFRDDFAPAPGNSFDLITVGGTIENPLSQYQVLIQGLRPGFQYTLTQSAQNTVRLTALNQGIADAGHIFADGFE